MSWLTAYAVRYRYVGVQVDLRDRFGLLSSVTETVDAIIARIHTLDGFRRAVTQGRNTSHDSKDTLIPSRSNSRSKIV